jgi:hypothetical protein
MSGHESIIQYIKILLGIFAVALFATLTKELFNKLNEIITLLS